MTRIHCARTARFLASLLLMGETPQRFLRNRGGSE